MSSPEESRGLAPSRESAIANIILYGGSGRGAERTKKRGEQDRSPRSNPVPGSGYSPEVPTQPVSETSTVTPSGAVYFTSTLPVR